MIFNKMNDTSKLTLLLILISVISLSNQTNLDFNGQMFDGYFEVGMDGIKNNGSAQPVSFDESETTIEIFTDTIYGKDDKAYHRFDQVYVVFTPEDYSIIYKDGSGNDERIANGDMVVVIGPDRPLKVLFWGNEKEQVKWYASQDQRKETLKEEMMKNPDFDWTTTNYNLPFNKIPMTKYNQEMTMPQLIEKIHDVDYVMEQLDTLKNFNDENGKFQIKYREVDDLINLEYITNLKADYLKIVDNILAEYLDDVFIKKGQELMGDPDFFKSPFEEIAANVKTFIEGENLAKPEDVEDEGYIESMFEELNRTRVQNFQKCADETIQQSETFLFYIIKWYYDNNYTYLLSPNKKTVWVYLEEFSKLRMNKFTNDEFAGRFSVLLNLIDSLFTDIIQKVEDNKDKFGFSFGSVMGSVQGFNQRMKQKFIHTISEVTTTQKSDLRDPILALEKQEFMDGKPDLKFSQEIMNDGQIVCQDIIDLLTMTGTIYNPNTLERFDVGMSYILTEEPVQKKEKKKGKKKKKIILI